MASPLGNDPLDPNRLLLNNGIQQGEYFVGPPVSTVNTSPVRNVSEYLAKQVNADKFVTLKVLTVANDGEERHDRQGKVLLYNEHLILSLLQTQPGVIHQHGLFRERNHCVLVLDCLVSHDLDPAARYQDFINLQLYVIKEKRLREKEALELFCNILGTMESLHKQNIVHRDLKLGNMVLNTRTREVTLTNFALSKHLVRENDALTDQRGSLAYVSPDVLSGNSYCGKSSDMWASGVLLYTMLYGQFPFYDSDPHKLFQKIRAAEYTIPNDGQVSVGTRMLIGQLIELDAKRRLTADRALETVQSIFSRLSLVRILEPAQIVPDMEKKRRSSDYMVPDQQELSPPTSIEASLASNLELNAVRLSLNSMLLPESRGSQMIGATGNGPSLSPTHSPYGSPSSSLIPSFVYESSASHGFLSGGNPFVCSSSTSFLSTSPTNSLGSSSPTHSLNLQLGGLTFHHPSSPSHSYPPPSLVCHRHPLTLSLSNESYFTSSSSPSSSLNSLNQSHAPSPSSSQQPTHSQSHSFSHPQTHLLHPNPSSQFLFPTTTSSSSHHRHQQETISEQPQWMVSSGQDVMESLVTTVRTGSHSTANRHGTSSSSNRHSYSEGERLYVNPSLLLPPNRSSHNHHRRRRNSSGSTSEPRVRRHSHGTSNPSYSLSPDPLSVRRQRRRSHDARDEQADLLESLRAVASRRNSRTQSPFVPIRVYGPNSDN